MQIAQRCPLLTKPSCSPSMCFRPIHSGVSALHLLSVCSAYNAYGNNHLVYLLSEGSQPQKGHSRESEYREGTPLQEPRGF